MGDGSYNGWANYESWAVFQWLSADPALETFVRGLCHSAAGRADVAEVVRTFVGDHNPLAGSANLYSDLLVHALRCVEWNVIAEAFLAA